MSELQTRFIDDTYVEYYNTGKHDLAQIYLKSEADKVIAEKDKEIAELKAQYNSAILWKYDAQNEHNTAVASCMEIIKLKAKLAKQDKELRRQKYKRCLAMAELCCERKENCYNIALRKYTKSEADSLVKKSEFWEEWEDTWTQQAYRFNKVYNENKNQEEQTLQ